MKVSELIELLQKADPNAEVRICSDRQMNDCTVGFLEARETFVIRDPYPIFNIDCMTAEERGC